MAAVIAPLLKQGQSPYQIVTNHPELGISEKRFTTISKTVFSSRSRGITVMDLRRQVSRKLPKKKAKTYKKRTDRKYLEGRTYKDYRSYLSDHPEVFVVQMDTVYNDETNEHVDNICAFTAPGHVVLAWTDDEADPQYELSMACLKALEASCGRLWAQDPGP